MHFIQELPKPYVIFFHMFYNSAGTLYFALQHLESNNMLYCFVSFFLRIFSEGIHS